MNLPHRPWEGRRAFRVAPDCARRQSTASLLMDDMAFQDARLEHYHAENEKLVSITYSLAKDVQRLTVITDTHTATIFEDLNIRPQQAGNFRGDSKQ